MNKIILITLMILFTFNVCRAIEPPDILKDHITNKKLAHSNIEDLKKEICNSPNDISLYKNLIKLQENAGLNADAVESYLMLANVYENSNMIDQAKLCYENALKLDPESEFLQKKSKTVYGIALPAKTYYSEPNETKPETKLSRYEQNRLNSIKGRDELLANSQKHINENNQEEKIYYNTLTPEQLKRAQKDDVEIVHTKNGTTYVRSKRDNDKSNNYSTKGNVNPYTGKAGTQ